MFMKKIEETPEKNWEILGKINIKESLDKFGIKFLRNFDLFSIKFLQSFLWNI